MCTPSYELVGIADILRPDYTEYHWGDEAKTYRPRSQYVVEGFQKKSVIACEDSLLWNVNPASHVCAISPDVAPIMACSMAQVREHVPCPHPVVDLVDCSVFHRLLRGGLCLLASQTSAGKPESYSTFLTAGWQVLRRGARAMHRGSSRVTQSLISMAELYEM